MAVGDALARFKQLLEGAGSSSADASCELLLAQLEPALAQCFRLCAIPHQFDRALLKVLLPASGEAQIQAFCESLSRLALVNVRSDGLALHDTARSYLFGKWLEQNRQEFREANARLRDHFESHLTGTAGQEQIDALRQRMFHWIGADQPAGIAEFERLCREARHAARLSSCATLIALVHEYDPILSENSRGVLAYHEAKLAADRNDWKLAQERLEQVLANTAVSELLHMKAHNRFGLVYLAQRKWDEAIAALENAERIARRNADAPELPLILHDMAVAYRHKGMRERSQELLSRSIKIAEKGNDLLCLARDYNSLGTLHRSYNEHREAIAAYEKSRGYLDQAHDHFRLAALYNNLGDEYSDLAEWTKSLQFFELSLHISEEAADTIGQARALTNLVRVYWNSNRQDEAIVAGQTAASYFTALRDDYSAGAAMLRVARLYRSARRNEAALEAYGRTIELFQKAGASGDVANVEEERAALVHPPGLPWAWAGIIVLVLVLVIFLVLLILVADRP